MEKLQYHTTYLIGAVDAISIKEAKGWRQDITPFLKSLGIFVLNPMDKPIDGYEEDEVFFKHKNKLKKEGRYQELYELGKPIRSFDLNCVDAANFLIVYLDLDVTLCGTWNELFIADSQRKPCLIVCKQGVQAIPDWLFFTFPSEFFFNSFEYLKKYIRGIHDGSIQNSPRWWFINYEKILPTQLTPPKPTCKQECKPYGPTQMNRTSASDYPPHY